MIFALKMTLHFILIAVRITYADSGDPDQTDHEDHSDQDLHCRLFRISSVCHTASNF